MRIRRVIPVVAFVALMFVSQDAAAGDRELWRYRDGYFVKLRGEHWQERGTKDESKFNYIETKRNDEFVELFDKNRGVTIRLRKLACMYQNAKGEKFTKLYDGTWRD